MPSGPGSVTVTFEDLRSLSGNLKQTMQAMEDTIRRAQSFIDTVVNVNWQGATAAQFHTLHANWQKSANDIQSAGNGLADFLNQAANAYEQTEQQLTQGLQKG